MPFIPGETVQNADASHVSYEMPPAMKHERHISITLFIKLMYYYRFCRPVLVHWLHVLSIPNRNHAPIQNLVKFTESIRSALDPSTNGASEALELIAGFHTIPCNYSIASIRIYDNNSCCCFDRVISVRGTNNALFFLIQMASPSSLPRIPFMPNVHCT